MKKSELRAAAECFINENFKFEKGDVVEITIKPEEVVLADALKRECKRLDK